MCIISNFYVWLIVLLITESTTGKRIFILILLICRFKYFFILGQINLPEDASWDQYGITIAGSSNRTNSSSYNQLSLPFDISITSGDVLYISDSANHRIVVVNLNSTTNISIIGSGPGTSVNQFNFLYGLATTNTSVYVIDYNNNRVQQMSLNGSNPYTVPAISELYTSVYLYVDNNNNIYLSSRLIHTVLLYYLNSTNYTIVAGTGTNGSNSDKFNTPYGIFVTRNRTLYVADSKNHRIMKWFLGSSSGILVAGTGIAGSSSTQLNDPTQVIVDTNEYIYVNDRGNTRIMRWGPNSTYGVCIAACTGTSGIARTQLNGSTSLAFDSYGSLYVSDRFNHRVQKFQIHHYQSKYTSQYKISERYFSEIVYF